MYIFIILQIAQHAAAGDPRQKHAGSGLGLRLRESTLIASMKIRVK
jgi:hypothetical protein